jgi:hypothetical protein
MYLATYVSGDGADILFLNNFSDQAQSVSKNVMRLRGLAFPLVDLVSQVVFEDEVDLVLAPCQYLWLQPQS